MIYEVVNFLKLQLESYLTEGRVNAEPLLVLSNPYSTNDNNNNKNSSFLNSITLIHIEEERIFKSQGHQVLPAKNGGFYKREPDLKLNLYLLISAYNKNYEDGLKFISKVANFFQRNNVFKREPDSPVKQELPANTDKIIVELFTASFDEQNQIWASLNTGYIPSLIYKIIMVVIDTDTNEKEYGGVSEYRRAY